MEYLESVTKRDTILQEIKAKLTTKDVIPATIYEIAKHLDLSISRVRGLVKEPGCDATLYKGEQIGSTKVCSLYDRTKVIVHYLTTLKQPNKKLFLIRVLVSEGILDENRFKV